MKLLRNSKGQPAVWTVLLLGILIGLKLVELSDRSEQFTFESSGPYRVVRVVDGDTLLLENDERVRLIGVDTPEVVHPQKLVEPFGPEATEFTRSHVEDRLVVLKYDRERRDRYRRILAYVYVEDWFLNEELIRAGLGTAELKYPYSQRMKTRFKSAEKSAKNARLGIWSAP